MEIQDRKVMQYFIDNAREFDDIYDNEGTLVKKVANGLFRRGMHQRFFMTVQFCMSMKEKQEAKNVLDIGCGAGRFAFPLEKAGLSFFGMDYSSEMIAMANYYLERYRKKINRRPRIKFDVSDFMVDFDTSKKYDITLAIGVFDYVESPTPFIKKMANVTNKFMVLSFPKKMTPQMPIRKIWLMLKNCPVYFYTKREVETILKKAGINRYTIKSISAGYLVFADLSR